MTLNGAPERALGPWKLSGLRRLEWLLLGVILTYGALLRGWDLSVAPLWVDEAETSINALTILQHGVPRDHYLGLPIFENTFSQPWAESPEYAFKDTSYSESGLAIYHGWFPLYAVAASFGLHGIHPDEGQSALVPRHSQEEMRRRTRAARMPALIFGTLFLAAIFFAARELYGIDAGWAALTAATVSTTAINFARQARYYSSTLTLIALCCLLLCMIAKRGRWRDFALGGGLFALLFHTNLLAFVTMCAAFILLLPVVRSHAQIGTKVLMFAGIIAAVVTPWILYTGFIPAAMNRPSARSLLSLEQMLRYPLDRLPYVLLAAAAIVWILAVPRMQGKVPYRFTGPFISSRLPFCLTAAWALLAFLIFVCLVPAASHFYSRLTLVIFVPSILFGAMLFAASARLILQRRSSILAAALFLLVLYPAGKAAFQPPTVPEDRNLFRMIDSLRDLDLRPGSRLYTESSENLILRFYTGMPFQNVMAVRKDFLERYEGDVLILESPWFEGFTKSEFETFLTGAEQTFTRGECVDIRRETSSRLLRENLSARGVLVPDFPGCPSEPVRALIDYQLSLTAKRLKQVVAETGNPMFDGYEIRDYRDMWQVFFFRFVDPAAHTGSNLNYAERIEGAAAHLLPGGWALLHSPAGWREWPRISEMR